MRLHSIQPSSNPEHQALLAWLHGLYPGYKFKIQDGRTWERRSSTPPNLWIASMTLKWWLSEMRLSEMRLSET